MYKPREVTVLRLLTLAALLLGPFFASAAVAGPNDPYTMSPAEVRMVQEKLYNLNYDITSFDGKVGPETRKAVAEFQAILKYPSTGILTEQQFAIFKEELTPAIWAAISSSTDGTYSAAWNHSSRASAARAASSSCQQRSSDPEKCVTITGFTNRPDKQAWIAAVQCRRSNSDTNYSYISVVLRPDKTAAVNKALEQAVDGGYSSSNCKLLTAIESRGRHK